MEEIIFTGQQKVQLRQLGHELAEAAGKEQILENKIALFAKSLLCLTLAANDRMAPADRRKQIFKPW
jgi:hypothetical protein